MSIPRGPHSASAPPTGVVSPRGQSAHALPESPVGKTAPTRRVRVRRRSAIWYPIRMMGMGTVGILGAFLLFQLYVKVNHPFRLGNEEARKVVALRERLKRQEQRNDGLDSELKYLESDEGKETKARQVGYHKPGEIVFLLDRDAISATQKAASPAETKTP